MSNTQVLLTAAGVIVTLIVAVWGITAGYMNRLIDQSERNTTRLIEQFERRMNDNAAQFEKRMNERDEKLLARMDALETRLNARIDKLEHKLEQKLDGEIRNEMRELAARVQELERRQFAA